MARPPSPRQMPREMSGASQQGSARHQMIIFDDLPKMNTKNMRQNLKEQEAAWIENLQPIAGNDLVVVPAPLFSLTTLPGKTVSRMFPAAIRKNVGDPTSPIIDYIIFFATDGSATAINAATGEKIEFAPPKTFVPPSDMTTYASERILIADAGHPNRNAPGGFIGAGYSTWDGTSFVKAGGVSPIINITNSSDTFTSTPTVSIVGGSGSGATAHAVIANGALVQIVLDNPGTGYLAGDQISVLVDGGGGTATATVNVWPRIQASSVAVFQGRVWLSYQRLLNWSGTQGVDDFDPANAAGFLGIADADLVHEIVGLRSLNNFLWIFGDQSVKQIGQIAVQQQQGGFPITQFQILTLASDIGCPFIMSALSYNRYTVFANKQGVYAAMGASVMKISDDLDGIFRKIDFAQELCAALFDLNNIHCYGLLGIYQDPDNTDVFGIQPQGGINPRSLIMCLTGFPQQRAWWSMNQGADLMSITSLPLQATNLVEMFGSSGSDVSWLIADPETAVTWILKTPQSAHQSIVKSKHGIKGGVALYASEPQNFMLSIDTENQSNKYALHAASPIVWRNHKHETINFINQLQPAGEIIFMTGPGFKLPYSSIDAYGRVVGASVWATSKNISLNAVMIEYVEADDWGLPP